MTLPERFEAAKHALFHKAYAQLNDKQREAVFHTEGPLLVLAGAGSGKTTVLVKRIAFLVRFGNAYHTSFLPPENVLGPFTEALEALAAKEDPPKEELDTALGSLAFDPAKPYQILAITFTNKAAGEIKSRLEAELGDEAYDVWAGTFHSVCAKLLRMHIDRLGYDNTFTIYDTDDQKRLMTAIIKDFGLSDKTFAPRGVLNEISRAKEKLIEAEAYETNVPQHDLRRRTVARLYTEYARRLKAANALDFDDLLLLTVKLLKTDEEIREKYRSRFRYILVDEYQDTNHAQFVFVKTLSNDEANVMVVGDDDQSIYKFRGATIENILSFDRTFPGAYVVKLEQNYRSTGTIVGAANGVIAHNKGRRGKTLWTAGADGEKITLRLCSDQNGEAAAIVNTITDFVASGEYRFEDFAVLYRMNAQSAALEAALRKSAVPYRLIGGTRFGERWEVKNVYAYLALIANPDDDLRLKRIINIPKRGIGDATVAALEEVARAEGKGMLTCALNAEHYPALSRAASKLTAFAEAVFSLREEMDTLPLGVFVEKVVVSTGYLEEVKRMDADEGKDRAENVAEVVSQAASFASLAPEATLADYLEEQALVADVDNYDPGASAVVLMTVHSAKGLEFPVVFLPGMEEGVFPGAQTVAEGEEAIEEERRLAYVALTRAKERLYILFCHSRLIFGRTEFFEPSRFVREIPKELCTEEVDYVDMDYAEPVFTKRRPFGAPVRPTPQTFARSAPGTEAPAETFTVGERVTHPVFGDGTVLSARSMAGDVLYEVAFDTGGTKKIMGNFAKMKRKM